MMTIKKLIILATVALTVCLIASIALACGPGPCGKEDYLEFCEKVPTDPWPCVQGGAYGKMEYNTAGPKFHFKFNGHKLNPAGQYTLIYYPDPWPGTGLFCLDTGKANSNGKIHLAGSVELNSDLPIPGDTNYPTGAKIWLVLSSDVDCTGKTMVGWNPTEYLFEKKLISYDDTDLLEVVDTVDINTTIGTPNTVACIPADRCISFYPEQDGNWGNEYGKGAVTAFLDDNDPAGYVILNGDKSRPKAVNIRHLDGLTDDSFDLYVLDTHGNWVKVGYYTDKAPGSTSDSETWVETQFNLKFDMSNNPVNLAGPNILIKILPTALLPKWWGFDTWGQLAIDKVELLGSRSCPDN